MEILYYLASFCLVIFMILATYDGFYLHIWKYQLFNRKESVLEHKTHSIRAILFPLIVWFLFITENNEVAFLIGCTLVIVDMIVLGIDAYSEKESRNFMGGLPQWEYIIHVFSNAFHFAAIALVLASKLRINKNSLTLVDSIAISTGKEIFTFISINIIPGSLVLALLHVLLLFRNPQTIWTKYRAKVICC